VKALETEANRHQVYQTNNAEDTIRQATSTQTRTLSPEPTPNHRFSPRLQNHTSVIASTAKVVVVGAAGAIKKRRGTVSGATGNKDLNVVL